MIVYGDPQFQATMEEALPWLIQTAQGAASGASDAWRALVIQAGQLEQAVADQPIHAPVRQHWLGQLEHWTDLLAEGFAAGCETGVTTIEETSASQPQLQAVLSSLTSAAASPPTLAPEQLVFKVPEGYEFYALFPEQFCLAAQAWLSKHPLIDRAGALVVGVRAIGTSLSALVAAVLRRAGWSVRRITVRPSGHPYDRQVELPVLREAPAAVLVVDEGPGLSGSSMASVARALSERGFTPDQISFLPGHPGLPGPAASEQVRQWWNRIPRFCVPINPCRFLATQTERLLHAPVIGTQDLSGGAWRACAYSEPSEWPPVASRFEATKLLCKTASGAQVLWKFIGLGSWVEPGRTAVDRARRLTLRYGPAGILPLRSVCRGFAELPWIDGQRLNRRAADNPNLLARAARHIMQIADAPLSATGQKEALRRLQRMLEHNLAAIGGSDSANRFCHAWSPMAEDGPAYGDGRLAPHEWILTPAGEIIKTDAFGHSSDHTIPGRQSVLWDVAGFVVEWNLTAPQKRHFLNHLAAAGLQVQPGLTFYELAYAAFRVGQTTLCRDLEPDGSRERHRLVRACEDYRAQLELAMAAIQQRVGLGD